MVVASSVALGCAVGRRRWVGACWCMVASLRVELSVGGETSRGSRRS